MRQSFLICVFITCSLTIAKVFDRCEFAKLAKENGFNNLSMWTCIAHQESRLNSESRDGDNYGIFQISSEAWCGKGTYPTAVISLVPFQPIPIIFRQEEKMKTHLWGKYNPHFRQRMPNESLNIWFGLKSKKRNRNL